MLFQHLHGPHDGLVGAGAPAAVGGLLKALHADGGDKVLHPQHLLGELAVDEGAVGKGQEHAVRVGLAQADDVVLAHHGLAAGEDVHIGAQLLALADDVVHGLKAHVQLVAVFRGPAAGAVQVAGGGGVHQNGPGDVAVVLGGGLLLAAVPDERGVHDEVLKEGHAHRGVDVAPQAHDELVPVVVGVFQNVVEHPALAGEGVVLVELVGPLQQLGQALFRVLVQIVENLFCRKGLQVFFHGFFAHRGMFLSLK